MPASTHGGLGTPALRPYLSDRLLSYSSFKANAWGVADFSGERQLAQKPSNGIRKVGEGDGLVQVSIHTGREALLAISGQSACRQRDDGNATARPRHAQRSTGLGYAVSGSRLVAITIPP